MQPMSAQASDCTATPKAVSSTAPTACHGRHPLRANELFAVMLPVIPLYGDLLQAGPPRFHGCGPRRPGRPRSAPAPPRVAHGYHVGRPNHEHAPTDRRLRCSLRAHTLATNLPQIDQPPLSRVRAVGDVPARREFNQRLSETACRWSWHTGPPPLCKRPRCY